jgi:hypothetical protein
MVEPLSNRSMFERLLAEGRLRMCRSPLFNEPAPDMLLRRAAIRDDRFKPTAIVLCDFDKNPCSHSESLNCFGRLENRLDASDH